MKDKETEFWIGLETMASGCGLMVDWQWAFGLAFELIRPFLRMTEKWSEWHPCREKPPCGCSHEIREIRSCVMRWLPKPSTSELPQERRTLRDPWCGQPKSLAAPSAPIDEMTSELELLACCTCPPGECEPFKVNAEDLILYDLDFGRFGTAVCKALGFGPGAETNSPGVRVRQVGMYAPAAAPVYFSQGSSDVLLRELGKLSGVRDTPFLLLTPTGRHCSESVDSLLRQLGAGHVSLSSALTPCPGAFRAMPAAEPMLREFERRVASLRDRGGTLRNIHQEIASVRKEFGEIRSAKQRLEKMQAEGLLAFTRKVDATSFKVLCAILGEGDVSKASRALGMPDASVRTIMRRWQGRGKEYCTMLELVRWRKKVGRRETLPLNDAVIQERAETRDYPGLLSDVLDGLLSVTEENWEERCGELADLLRPVVRC